MKIFHILPAMTDCVKSYPWSVKKTLLTQSIFDKITNCYRRIKVKVPGKN